MKFSVSTLELQKHLGIISGVIPAKSTIPIIENFLFDLDNQQLSITATDLDMYTTILMKVDSKNNGTIVIPAKRLLEIIRSLPDTTIQFVIDTESNKIIMRTENGEYKLAGESAENYPRLPEFKEEKELTINCDILRRLIAKTEFAVSADELRPAMTGVLFEIRSNEISAVATDGHRLAKLRNKGFSTKDKGMDIIIPVKALRLIAKSLEETESVIYFNESHVKFSLKNLTLVSRLIEEKYPNYESVIPTDNTKKVMANKNQLLSAVKRTSLFANTATRQVRLSLKNGSMIVSAEDIDLGSEAKETLSCDYAAEEMEIGFNSNYIVDILTHIDTEEAILMLSTPTRAAMIRPSEQPKDEDILMLVMPVRINA